MEVREIALAEISVSPFQPRKHFNEIKLQEFAADIKKRGIIHPVIVRRVGDAYQLVVGERRVRAARIVGLATIPAFIKELSDYASAETAFAENFFQEDLSYIEEATILYELKELGRSEEEIAEELSMSILFVRDRLALLRLPIRVQNMLEAETINLAQAKVIRDIEDEEAQIAAAEYAARLNLSAAELKGQTQHLVSQGKTHKQHTRAESVSFERLTRDLIRTYDDLVKFDCSLLTDERSHILKKQILALAKIFQDTLEKIKQVRQEQK